MDTNRGEYNKMSSRVCVILQIVFFDCPMSNELALTPRPLPYKVGTLWNVMQ